MALLAACGTQGALAQATNVIPDNVYPTDDGLLFAYKRTGERLVRVTRLEQAAGSSECRPADQDPRGHWGTATNGFQLSLRLDQTKYTNGEPVAAVWLVRNVSNAQAPYGGIQIQAMKDGKLLERRKGRVFILGPPPGGSIFPHTQHKDQKRLDKIYDLRASGDYVFRAVCAQPQFESQEVKIQIGD